MTELYGIRNCDTVRRARAWLDALGVAYRFHDYKAQGIDAEMLAGWVDRLGWDMVLNRAGTTFRSLPEVEREGLDRDRATALMLAQPSMIRRPMLVHGDTLHAGFSPERYAAVFGPSA